MYNKYKSLKKKNRKNEKRVPKCDEINQPYTNFLKNTKITIQLCVEYIFTVDGKITCQKRNRPIQNQQHQQGSPRKLPVDKTKQPTCLKTDKKPLLRVLEDWFG